MNQSLRSLVLAFVEDGAIHVFDGRRNAAAEFEGIDVESGTVVFFDGSGVRLEPRFKSPNKTGSLLRKIGWVKSGEYELEPLAQPSDESLPLLLFEARSLEPNPWFASKEELALALRNAGVSANLSAASGGEA